MADRKDTPESKQATGADHKASRRKALKSTLIGGAVISTSVAPDRWKKPVLDSVVLPAHAATTDDTDSGGPSVTTTPEATTTPEVTTTPEATTTPTIFTTPPFSNTNVTFQFSFSDWVDHEVS